MSLYCISGLLGFLLMVATIAAPFITSLPFSIPWWGYLISVCVIWVLFNIYFNGGSNPHYPNLAGKVIVITGANSGIGYEAAE